MRFFLRRRWTSASGRNQFLALVYCSSLCGCQLKSHDDKKSEWSRRAEREWNYVFMSICALESENELRGVELRALLYRERESDDTTVVLYSPRRRLLKEFLNLSTHFRNLCEGQLNLVHISSGFISNKAWYCVVRINLRLMHRRNFLLHLITRCI